MKLEMILGIKGDNMFNGDLKLIEEMAYSSNDIYVKRTKPLQIIVTGYTTNRKELPSQEKDKNGKRLYVSVNSPAFLNVNEFYRELNQEGYTIIDSKVSQPNYRVTDYEIRNDASTKTDR